MKRDERPSEESTAPLAPLFLADHPALDFLNTVLAVDGARIDLLQSDKDVAGWLSRAGWPIYGSSEPKGKPSLLEAARALRKTIRTLVEQRKQGHHPDPSDLNTFLKQAHSHLELVAAQNGALSLERKWHQATAAEMLAPLAESAADLLANGDFDLIRRCESSECVLWFYDRTKSHHRRWCSMAGCGNRHKVAAYRKRKQSAE